MNKDGGLRVVQEDSGVVSDLPGGSTAACGLSVRGGAPDRGLQPQTAAAEPPGPAHPGQAQRPDPGVAEDGPVRREAVRPLRSRVGGRPRVAVAEPRAAGPDHHGGEAVAASARGDAEEHGAAGEGGDREATGQVSQGHASIIGQLVHLLPV